MAAKPKKSNQRAAPKSSDARPTPHLASVRRLARAMAEGDLSELEYEDRDSGLRLRLRRGFDTHPAGHMLHVVQGAAPAAQGPAAAPASGSASAAPGAVQVAVSKPEGVPFPCPMVGTFYRSASPETEPFVEAGSEVEEDSVLCIIEAMKVMNEVRAETRGTIVEVLVQNGEPVEFGQPLFLIRPA